MHTNKWCSYGMENHVVSNLTLSCSCCPKMVDGPEDEPEGPLLITTDPQDLHGCLQLGKLLGGPLLILSLADSTYIQIKCLFELLTTKIPVIRLKVILLGWLVKSSVKMTTSISAKVQHGCNEEYQRLLCQLLRLHHLSKHTFWPILIPIVKLQFHYCLSVTGHHILCKVLLMLLQCHRCW